MPAETNVTIDVLILAAGLGTRMKSRRAKVLHRAGGLSLIEHVVEAALAITTPERITVVVGHQGDQVKALLKRTGVGFAEQKEQKGTGHAVMCARDIVSRDGQLLMVLYGDTPLLSSATLHTLGESQRLSRAAATVITTDLEDPTGYGRVILDAHGDLETIVEQKAATPEQLLVHRINSGIYCFRAPVLWKHLDEIGCDNPAGEFYLTDIVSVLRAAGETVAAMRVSNTSELLGINTRIELAEVDHVFRRRKVRELMLSGVTIEKAETVSIDNQVRVGMDTVIEPFARILGNTEIGEDCRIGAGSIIEDSRLGSNIDVQPYTLIRSAQVGESARLGPFSRLRPDTRVGANAHVGNFVELKNTRLGDGAKANHLAYLGDSDIGEKVNVGAGTITCNYDGFEKHRTRIGRGAFIGSNATLVAPIDVGEGSYVGAGSVITDPVPPDALALGRGRQVNKGGWVKKRKKK
ncbi:MAG: bifunctional UDP-N-acetylglucosamine diphosphorylase/glucosamine-1-phosphate N-acetyltransferase GlmU [Acidobacteriota bacterium]|nr:bifunctional UDP-N-acetylglucosamine diphosphorylase/glucosamine-1-phosphate N-acetyltransferase GlmU [Acidobacteriota bacterium]